MAFIDDTIANWTPAQLQSFIQSITSVDATQIPSSLNFLASEIASGKIDNLSVNNKLDLAAKVGTTQAGQPVDESLVLSADSNSQLQFQDIQDWEHAHLVTGDTWAGMNYHPSTFSGSTMQLTNQRLALQLIHVKKKMFSTAFVYSVTTGDSGATYSHNGYALYGPWTPGDTSVSLLRSFDGGSTAGPFTTTGNANSAGFDPPITTIQPGYYFFAFLSVWSAMGTAPALYGGQIRGLTQAVSGTNFSRSCGFNSHTSGFPSTISPSDSGFLHFENSYWVGAVAS